MLQYENYAADLYMILEAGDVWKFWNLVNFAEIIEQLDSMCWFSHRHRTGGGPHPRGPLRKKMPHEDCASEDDLQTKCHTFSFFYPRWPWLLTLTFELGWDFCTMHLTAKFHHPTFNCSEVIMLTNNQTDKQTDAAENSDLAPLCYIGG